MSRTAGVVETLIELPSMTPNHLGLGRDGVGARDSDNLERLLRSGWGIRGVVFWVLVRTQKLTDARNRYSQPFVPTWLLGRRDSSKLSSRRRLGSKMVHQVDPKSSNARRIAVAVDAGVVRRPDAGTDSVRCMCDRVIRLISGPGACSN